jgi:hypothetical protein
VGTINNSLGHQFTIDEILGKEFTTDTFVNVVKRREQVIYRTSLEPESANIAFVTSQEISSGTNLSIADRSTSLSANRATVADHTSISGTKTFTISTENFVVTDVFATGTNTISPVPLFYKHILSIDNVPRDETSTLGLDIDTGITVVSVEILDQLLQPIKVSEKYLDETQGILYSNLLSEFATSGDYTVYYVKYVVNNNGNVQTFVDLLDNQNVYRIADFEDLTPLLTLKTDGRKVYLIEETTSGFTITLPVVGSYAYKPLSVARIQIIPPVGFSTTDSWYVRITDGKFFTNFNGSLLKYSIAEFLTQSFNPEPPIKTSQSEYSTVLSNTLIKLDRENIYEDSDTSLYVEIQINDSDGNGVAAVTTDPTIVDNVAANGKVWTKWDTVDRTGIRSINHRTGVVDIEGVPLKSSYNIRSSYYFTETNYELTLFNFNPISNKEALSHTVSVFTDPEGVLDSKDQTLYFLKIDESGKIVESNWTDFDNQLQIYDPDADGVGIPLYYENFPSFLPVTGHANFVQDFTVESSGVQISNFLILGDVTVSPATTVDEVISIDSRRRGGGIIDTQMETVIGINPEVQWYWDEGYWDGTPYPGNASYLVEVPVDILTNTPSGVFTQQEVRDVVERHTALGMYPLTRAYGIDVTVSGLSVSGNDIELRWYANV